MAKAAPGPVGTSKLLSYVLRHAPESIGIELDGGGWASVDVLLAALARHGRPLSRAELEQLVQTSDKRRFAFSADGARIRASQGHSVAVDLGYLAQTPPEVLFHGTLERLLPAIRDQGLHKGRRHHVHLSSRSPPAPWRARASSCSAPTTAYGS